ncbi:hypothetical protein T265_00982 [Opisthorchis viverrini]|uniref:Zinc finger PHD-type domain-containing protein n=1 Tax=Opisthorchis viverrini TaxID=6198 RepID=A0A075AJB3_OPIVI|nr:hypothetical protein T265_00982 [Opisthorchis viverrini]KER33084.1 hypothetical protein T265_00982 [Opisthorchis viverrini]
MLHLFCVIQMNDSRLAIRVKPTRKTWNGCPSNVKRSMQCHACKAWWHFKCTGLQDDQISRLANSPDPFVCASCLYVKGAMHTVAKRVVPRNGTQSPVQMPKDHCQCSALIGILDAKLEPSILPRAENIKSSATPFFHLCLSGERQPLTDKNKTDPGNLGKSLDPVYQSVNP